MLLHKRSLFGGFTLILILIITASGQDKSTQKKEVPEIRRGVVTTLVPNPSYDLETTLSRYPCKGEQPGNVLGISEQAPVPQRVAGFIKKLRETNPKTRACAALQLGYLGPDAQDALPHLIRLFYEDDNQKVRSHAEDGLWKIGPGRPTDNLNESMLRRSEWLEMIKAPDVHTRFYAAFSLGYYKPTSDAKPIVLALIAATDDQDRLVKWMAIRSIGRLGPHAAEAVPVLIKFLQTNDRPMRVQSILALYGIGPAATPAVPALLNELYGKDYDLHLFSAMALARIGPVILPILERDLKTHPFQILQVLSYMGSAAGVPLLMEALRMENKEVRMKAMDLIQWRGDAARPAVPLLVNALSDKDTKTRQEATVALKHLGPVAKDAVPALIVKLTDGDSLVRCRAAEALGAIGPAANAAVPKLVQMMKTTARSDDDDSQRCAAKGLMTMSAETKTLVPANMIKKVLEWDALIMSVGPSLSDRDDPTKPKPKPKDKPLPRSY
jgi:HEAT repeat protein